MTIGALTIPPVLFLYFAVFLAECFLYRIKGKTVLFIQGVLSAAFSMYGVYTAVNTRTQLRVALDGLEESILIRSDYPKLCTDLYDKLIVVSSAAVILFSIFLIICTVRKVKFVYNYIGRWTAGMWFLMQFYAFCAGLSMIVKGFDFGSYAAAGVFHISLLLHMPVFICMLIKRRKEKWGIK